MDTKDKITKALLKELKPEYLRLEDDDGISGFVVSSRFENTSSLDRQEKIEAALSRASLAQDERRKILMIAGLTPQEYEAVGARIRIQKIKEMAGGGVEVSLHGGLSDAEYVRGTLNREKGVQTTDPKRLNGEHVVLMSFQAKGTGANPLTKERAIGVLKNDAYIEIGPDA